MGGVGFLIGSISASTLVRRIGLGSSRIVALLINGVGRLVIQTTMYGPAPFLLAAFWLFANISMPIYNITRLLESRETKPAHSEGQRLQFCIRGTILV